MLSLSTFEAGPISVCHVSEGREIAFSVEEVGSVVVSSINR